MTALCAVTEQGNEKKNIPRVGIELTITLEQCQYITIYFSCLIFAKRSYIGQITAYALVD